MDNEGDNPAGAHQSNFGAALDRERQRFFLWSPVALGGGIALYFSLRTEPELWLVFVPLAAALILQRLIARGTLASAAMTAIVLAAAGFAIAKVRVETVRAPVLEKPIRNVVLAGTVIRVEPRPPRGARVTINVAELGSLKANARPRTVRVRVLANDLKIQPGDRIRLTASLAPPAKPALPGAFDFARTAWFEGLGAVGYAVKRPVIEPRGPAATYGEAMSRGVAQFRQAITARIHAVLPGETGAIAAALITGERGGISPETNDAYRGSGLFHILSISGLHMVIMAGAVFFSVRLVLAAIPALALRYPIKKWAAVAGIAAAVGYLSISGAAFATVRAAIMIVIIFGAVLLDRPALALRNVALSAFAILLLYPESLFDAGFQMSFAAVTGLVATYEEVRRRMGRRDEPHPILRVLLFFGGIVFSTLIASIAVAPFAAYHFHQSQQYAVLANLIAIPICNIVVMPMALAALVLMPIGLEAIALIPMGLGIDAMTWCAAFVAKIPGAVGHVPAIPAYAFILMVLGGLWIALWHSQMRIVGAVLVLAGVALTPFMPRADVLVARNGDLVALRGPDGRLSALPARQSKYEVERWLEHDGDSRAATEAQKGTAFTCDGIGCTASVKGARVAVARHPAAIRDDCDAAQIIVLSEPRPKFCNARGVVIDVFDVWRDGTHAIYIDADPSNINSPRAVRIDTVAAHRGERPWSPVFQRPIVVRAAEPAPPRPNVIEGRDAPLQATPPLPPRSEAEDDDYDALQDIEP